MKANQSWKKKMKFGSWLLAGGLAGVAIYFLYHRSGEEFIVPDGTSSALESVPEALPYPAAKTSDPPALAPTGQAETPTSAGPAESVLDVQVFTRQGEPVENADLLLTPRPRKEKDTAPVAQSPAQGRTDSEGKCRIGFPGAGNFWITACRGADRAIASVKESRYAAVELVLQPSQVIRGSTVTRAGKPVPNATVAAFNVLIGRGATPILPEVITDADGEFEIGPVLEGSYVLVVRAAGYAETSYGPAPAGGAAVAIVVGHGGTFEGRIKEVTSGKGSMSGVLLRLRSHPFPVMEYVVESDARGIALLQMVAAGQYKLSSVTDDAVLVPHEQLVTIEDGKVARVDLQVQPGASISGRVFDANSRAGIPEVAVSLRSEIDPANWTIFTDSSGHYSFRALPSGDYSVGLSDPPSIYGASGLLLHVQNVSLEQGQAREGFDFPLSSGRLLRGQVLTAEGAVVPGSTVTGLRQSLPEMPESYWSQDAQTDAEGNFVLADVPGEGIYVSARHRARSSAEIGPIAVPPEGLTGVILTLDSAPTSSIAGRVVDSEGAGVQSHVVAAFGGSEGEADDRKFQASTDADGYFFLSEVPVGECSLGYGSYTNGLVELVNSAGPFSTGVNEPLRDVLLVLDEQGLAIEGRVLSANGEPMPDYMISVDFLSEQGRVDYAVTATDASGAFAVHNLEDGLYELHNYSSRQGAWRHRVNAGESVEVELPVPTVPEE